MTKQMIFRCRGSRTVASFWLMGWMLALTSSLQAEENGSCASCRGSTASQSLPILPTNGGGPEANLKEVHFSGVERVDPERLQALAADYLGRPISVAVLEELAARVTALYHAQGYFLAQALVPVQRVRDGRVEISVLEGRLGQVRIAIDAQAPIDEARVRGYLAALRPGEVLQADSYERAMLLLSDLPGIKVRSGLQQGVETGTTDLLVEVTAAKRWNAVLDLNNHGNRETGRIRGGGSMRWASPAGIGDNLDVGLMMSEDNGVNYGRLAYELPLGSQGVRFGMGLSRVAYDQGGAFSSLDANGTARIGELTLSWPVLRQRNQNLILNARLDYKKLSDRLDEFDWTNDRNVRGLGAGWIWERRDDWGGGGYWSSGGSLYYGNLRLEDSAPRAADRGPMGLHTEGDFFKLSVDAARLQSIAPNHSLYVSIGAQLASRNLDSSEKLALGGVRGVRAYATSELLVDEGWLANLEWRWTLNEQVTPYLFYDFGRGRRVHSAPSANSKDNWDQLSAAGLGLSWGRPGDFMLNLSLAWRLTPKAETDGGDHRPRLFAQIQKQF